jgi:hypothetical protein
VSGVERDEIQSFLLSFHVSLREDIFEKIIADSEGRRFKGIKMVEARGTNHRWYTVWDHTSVSKLKG